MSDTAQTVAGKAYTVADTKAGRRASLRIAAFDYAFQALASPPRQPFWPASAKS